MPYSTTSVLNSDTGFAGEAHNRLEQSPSLATVLVALGIVYGYLGTSPLYALQTIVHIVGHEFTPEEALGSLSLVVWSLIITISVKYSVFVMRADNHGEGGILALMAMTGADWSGRRRWLVICGLFGAALIYGDGIITPRTDRLASPFLAVFFLALTGGEALYADMGHVGRNPIRLAWYCIVLPALVLNYAGQVGNFLDAPDMESNPFFKLAPSWAIYPLVALATLATIIASQAIITGSFSMTRQAMQLGWFPGVWIDQTSAEAYGQIYVPFVNWTMMFFTAALTAGFGSSERLAGAYGTAVSTTMVLTTILLYEVMRRRWRWTLYQAAATAALLLTFDLAFFSANLLKILEGGWIPLTFGILVFTIMTTWHYGVEALHQGNAARSQQPTEFFARLRNENVVRVSGTAIFLTRLRKCMPPIIINYGKQGRCLHQTTIALTVSFESVPRVRPQDRMRCESLGEGFWHVTVHYGFVEIPDLSSVICRATREGVPAWGEPIYYIERHDPVSLKNRDMLSRCRIALFGFMSRNSAHAVDRFRIPSNALVEIGRRIEL
jgi:KUP system potassium uptake protein